MNMNVQAVLAVSALAAFTLHAEVSAAMRPTPEYLKSAIVYQVVLRNFTRDGNFRSATAMLDHVRSVGVDVVYLTPFVEMDCDMDERGWSPRQIKSGYHTPKNPYRISNYDRIDPEYGHDADFKAFNDRAHALGMKVYMDLVYLHCGPNNVLKDMFDDAFLRNPDGSVRTTQWRFPYVNFGSKAVRRYLIESMLHWMRLGCDGFRCDVGDQVPIDFWVEAVTECQKVKPDLVMINEGIKPEWLEKAFDACYDWHWGRLRGHLAPTSTAEHMTLPVIMDKVRDYEAKLPTGALCLCFMDNHDTAADAWENRFDRVLPVEAGNAAFALTLLRRGLPLVFNGNEIADNALNTFFAPVEDVARARKTVDWARALQPAGQKRLALIRALARLRHEMPVFAVRNAEIKNWRYLKGENRMARFSIATEGEKSVECLLFHDAAEAYDSITSDNDAPDRYDGACRADVLGTVEINRWRDETHVQMIAKYVLPAGTPK